MAVGFNTVEFKVVLDGDMLPVPVLDPNSGRETYSATVLLDSSSDMATLKSLISGVTIIDALGGGGIIVVSRGLGKKTLTYPTADGGETSHSAILTNMTSRVRQLYSGYIEAVLEFQLVDA